MYMILLVLVFISGLVLLFSPCQALKKLPGIKEGGVCTRVIGFALLLISFALTWAVWSGAVVLPLFK